MSSSFWSGEFYFDGIYSNLLNVCIIDFDTNERLKQIGNGVSIELNEESSFNGEKSYSESSIDSTDNITLQLCRTNGNSWSEGAIAEIYNWLFKKDFKRFQTLDYHSNYNLCCYLKAVSFKKVLNPSFEGYLEIEFKPYTPYWYSIPTSSPILLDGEIKSIVNYSNLYETYKPKVKITNIGASSTNIKVINESNNTFIEVLGLSDNEVVIIDCKMGTVINSDNINRFEILQDYNLLELSKGDNKIRLNGNAKVEFICEFPIII